ncbi:Protein PatA (fragment) [Hyella patelloides LEGE 07179]|uniref:Protein PatA n=1 Tax=Hyella patelloides LEGE 07179 TaxID=945734 RepID=A0A563W0W7_9CYAN
MTAIDDPVQAVPTIFRIKPDLILLDITMPKINGYKLCGLLRDSKNCDRIPIIMVTGNTGFIDKARAKIAGATDYFTKPFTQQGLMQIVEKYLQ